MRLSSQADIEKALREIGMKHSRYYFSSPNYKIPKPVYATDNIKLFTEKQAVKIAIKILSTSKRKLPYTELDIKSLLTKYRDDKKIKKTEE